jgi:hypothetical protein
MHNPGFGEIFDDIPLDLGPRLGGTSSGRTGLGVLECGGF